MMWYGVLGTKELLHRTYRNLEQKVLLEVSTGPPAAAGGRGCLASSRRTEPLGPVAPLVRALLRKGPGDPVCLLLFLPFCCSV